MTSTKHKSDIINILFTSISNKVSLVECFRDAYKKHAIRGSIIGADINPYSTGLYAGDTGYIVPKLYSVLFRKEILEICTKENIRLIIPTRDEDLVYFSKHKNFFASKGVRIMVADKKTVALCNDKGAFHAFLKKYGIPTVKTWTRPSKKIPYPCIVKPKDGKGGRGIKEIRNRQALLRTNLTGKIIQEKITGTEYTIDYFADFKARPICIVPRIRLVMKDGESKVGITKKHAKIIRLSKKLGQTLGLIGHNTIQCFETGDGGVVFLEVNPRFGGGAPLGIKAGCKSPEYILLMLSGEKLKTDFDFTENLIMLRHTKDIFLKHDKLLTI